MLAVNAIELRRKENYTTALNGSLYGLKIRVIFFLLIISLIATKHLHFKDEKINYLFVSIFFHLPFLDFQCSCDARISMDLFLTFYTGNGEV